MYNLRLICASYSDDNLDPILLPVPVLIVD